MAPPPSLSHSPDLGRVGAQRTTLMDRFLAQSPHLLFGRPRPARIWLILDLTKTGCLNSKNQDTLDSNLWWRYLGFEWQYPSRSFRTLVSSVCHRLPYLHFTPAVHGHILHFFWPTTFLLTFLLHHRASYLALFLLTVPSSTFSFASHPCFHSQDY